METKNIKAFGTEACDAPLKQINIVRREITPKDIEIEILYCGVCHSDLHTARNDWGGTIYPAVPGHEIVGKVTRVGNEVTKLKVGDFAGVALRGSTIDLRIQIGVAAAFRFVQLIECDIIHGWKMCGSQILTLGVQACADT